MIRRLDPTYIIFTILGGLVLLFVIAPLLGIFLNTTGKQFSETIRDEEVTGSVWLTLFASMAATAVFAVMAVPFAYILARRNFPLKELVEGIIDLPVVIPHSAAGIALLGVLVPVEESTGIQFIGGIPGIMAAMAFVSIPFLMNAARDGFAAVDEKLEKAALNLGASPARVFFTISLPLAWRSVISGLVLMWGRGMSEFGAVVMIAYHPMITPVMIYERFGAFGLEYARPVAAIFLIVCFLFFIVMRLVAGRRRYA